MESTLQKAVKAYGGEALWRDAKYIEATVDTKGLAFQMKRRPVFNGVKIRIDVHQPYARLFPIGKRADIAGILDGPDVRLEDSEGKVIEVRQNARDYFSNIRQVIWWDDLDMSYFGNYAMWNYLALPALLLREDIKWSETKPGSLKAIFPRHLPTHCQTQEFHFDTETGLLKQHDYTAEVISKLAQAANRVTEHAQNERRLMFASKRLVTPRLPTGKALSWPTLIAISIREYNVISVNT